MINRKPTAVILFLIAFVVAGAGFLNYRDGSLGIAVGCISTSIALIVIGTLILRKHKKDLAVMEQHQRRF